MDEINTTIVQQNINDFEEKANRLLAFLENSHKGKKNSITSANLIRWGNERQVRSFIHYLRINGHPICSYSKGYFYANTKEEIDETIRFILDPRVLEVVEALKDTMNKFE